MKLIRAAALLAVLLTGVAATPAPASSPRPNPSATASARPAPSAAASPAAVPATTPAPTPTPSPAPAAYRGYFNWYDLASPGMLIDDIHVVNTGAAPVTGTVRLGAYSLPYSLNAGEHKWLSFAPGVIGGPLVVDATGPVLATQRVTYRRTFSEISALPGPGITDGWWPWFDNASPGMIGDNIHLFNPDPAIAATVAVKVGGATAGATVQPGTETWITFPAGTMGGPIHLTSDHPVIASQRVETTGSFNELPALAAADAGTSLTASWYDLASPGFSADNLHIVNTAGTDATVNVAFQGTSVGTVVIPPAGERHLSFPVGTIGGPLTLSSNQKIVATQRVNYYDAFQEVPLRPASAATTDLWFPWYDDASPCFIGDNLHVTNPGPGTAAGQLSLAGQAPLTFNLAAGQEAILNWPRGTIGGPMHLTSNGGVLVDQRVVICAPPPPPPPPSTRRIVVSLSQQHLWAYDNGNLAMETDVTTGRPELPTPTGSFHIFYRATPYKMISPWPYGSPYWYPDAWVTWVLEFIQGGYFLHDAPWRTWYGPGSQFGDGTHGCVNIPGGAMQWLWNWAQIGDEVDVVG